MKFNADRFLKYADNISKKLVTEPHRKALDGKEVIDGEIRYSIDGEEYYLYPVLPEWCDV